MDEKIKRQDSLVDSHGRIVNYLRLSVTDRCNLKCQYCHPPHKIEYLDRSNICSYRELLQVVRVASQLGINKIRLTGGELFLRRDIDKFVSSLHEIKGIKEISLTTNG
ncbi:MAG: radical SAM protein, partial [Deltaproteobacteria bacterium]|nr:radical SAM protein [Deltaproteobacteria bacterium]